MEQIDIFNLLYEDFKFDKNKPIRLFEAFAGIGTQAMALKRLGLEVEHVGISEVDKHAIKSYEAIHGKVKNFGGIGSFERFPAGIDICTWSFPCFTGDTLVMTETGNKKLIEINVGDKVLTHDKTYEKVTKFFDQGYKEIYKIDAMAFHELRTTSNHRFYVRKKSRVWENEKRTYKRIFGEPQWVETRELKENIKDYYMGVSINQKSIIPTWNGRSYTDALGRNYHVNEINPIIQEKEFWHVIGRYIADGWIRTNGGIVIASNKEKLGDITERLEKLGVNYNLTKETTSHRVHIPRKEWSDFVEQFGYYAHGKHLSEMSINLPRELLKELVDGYLSGDGYINEKGYNVSTTTSIKLVYDMAHAVAKAYQRPYSIYKNKTSPTKVIEGREINQKDTYTLVFKKDVGKQDNSFYEDGYIWFPINKIKYDGEDRVYDIEVENSHSFLANGTIAHNCQDISLAGKQKGMSEGTRSNYGYVFLDTVENTPLEERPKVLLMENVKALIGKNFEDDWREIQLRLEHMGYTNYSDVLVATDYGIPQTRERVFVVSILGDYNYNFPKPIKLERFLKDFLEEDVDEKYYLSDKQTLQIAKWNAQQKPLENAKSPEDEVIQTITAKSNTSMNASMVLIKENQLFDHDSSERFRRVLGNKVAPTLKARSFLSVAALEDNCLECQTDLFKGDISIKEELVEELIEEDVVVEKDKIESYKIALDKKLRIRKLTPLEAWRLMGISDEDFYKAKNAGVSDTQLYKQAGNAIVVDVLVAIFREMVG